MVHNWYLGFTFKKGKNGLEDNKKEKKKKRKGGITGEVGDYLNTTQRSWIGVLAQICLRCSVFFYQVFIRL